MKPIYKPKGRAGEYGDYAINIYTGCNHGCTYCYAAKMAKRFGKDFYHVEPREGIVRATKKQIESEEIRDKLIHLCFTCDPYPADIDTNVTREIIKSIKDSGNHVQILTKGGERAERDFDLLDCYDWFGVTHTNDSWFSPYKLEPNASTAIERLSTLQGAKACRIKTWVSCEPVFEPEAVYLLIKVAEYIDLYKIGKLNYASSNINWGEFGRECERLCKEHGRNYYIKQDLRDEMNNHK